MNILLVEDDLKIASFIIQGLNQAGFAVVHATDGEDGLIKARTTNCDAAVIDIMLPIMDGLSLIGRLRAEKISLPVLILSAKRSVDDRVKGLQTGGDDYLTKPFAFSELLARIQALIRRAEGTPEPDILTYDDLSLNLLNHEVIRQNQQIILQPREFTLLAYLMRNAEKIVSKTMIMEHVWGYNFDPRTNVVEARISKLRDKIDKPFSGKLITTIRGAGYVLKKNV